MRLTATPISARRTGCTNFYQCCCFSFGIAQAAGAGKSLSEWIVDGAPEWDLLGA